jgi:4-oxalocrotonate tautomerase
VPLVRISLNRDAGSATAREIGERVHRAMVETINVPPDDTFQILTGHAGEQVVYPASYLGISHTDAIVIIQITLNAGRTIDQKRALYARIADLLAEPTPGIGRSDIIVNLVEVAKENWSFGDGVAQYAT